MTVAPRRLDCLRSGALFSPLHCGACPELTMRGAHHCERWLMDLAVALGGLHQTDVAALLGVDRTRVRQVEERALGKVGAALKMRGVM